MDLWPHGQPRKKNRAQERDLLPTSRTSCFVAEFLGYSYVLPDVICDPGIFGRFHVCVDKSRHGLVHMSREAGQVSVNRPGVVVLKPIAKLCVTFSDVRLTCHQEFAGLRDGFGFGRPSCSLGLSRWQSE